MWSISASRVTSALLSDCYDGEALREIYAIDPGTGKEVQIDVDRDLSDEEVERAIAENGYTSESHRKAVELVIPVLLQRSEDRARQSAIWAAFQHAADELGIKDGDVLDEGRVREQLSLLVARQLVPYVLALQRRGHGNPLGQDEGGSSSTSE